MPSGLPARWPQMLGITASLPSPQVCELGLVVGDAEVQVGLARHQQDPGGYRAQRGCQVAVMTVVRADVGFLPGYRLCVQVRRPELPEVMLPVGDEEGGQVGGAQRGFEQALPIEVLAEAPARVDMAERPQRRRRLAAELAVAEVFWRRFKRPQQPGKEHLVVQGSTGAAADDDRPLDEFRVHRGPVVRLARAHREPVRRGHPGDAEMAGQQSVPRRTLSAIVTTAG